MKEDIEKDYMVNGRHVRSHLRRGVGGKGQRTKKHTSLKEQEGNRPGVSAFENNMWLNLHIISGTQRSQVGETVS
eukprot:1157212-Pelagomonas_calceolata.AAC.1